MNTLLNALLHTPGLHRWINALRATFAGGMAVQPVVAARWKEVTATPWPRDGTHRDLADGDHANPIGLPFNGSVGLPVSSTDVSIRDDDGAELPVNGVGEICVFGPQVMRGYWNRPDETEKVMFGDWLRTGDIGRMDENGFVYIEDRKKDMILVSGFNVYPNEIESVIAAHPGVLEVAAVAQNDENSGEVVALFVVKKDPHRRSTIAVPRSLRATRSRNISPHQLPKTVGKILPRPSRRGSRCLLVPYGTAATPRPSLQIARRLNLPNAPGWAIDRDAQRGALYRSPALCRRQHQSKTAAMVIYPGRRAAMTLCFGPSQSIPRLVPDRRRVMPWPK